MRYRYEEYAPSNKKQYVIAVGLHELRALMDAAIVLRHNTPERTVDQRELKTALASSIKGLKAAIAAAEKGRDSGKRRRPYAGEDYLLDPTKKVSLTYEEALAMLPDGDRIRVLFGGVSPGTMPRDEVLDLLVVGQPELSGPTASERGYGICAYQNIYTAHDGDHGSPVFIEGKED